MYLIVLSLSLVIFVLYKIKWRGQVRCIEKLPGPPLFLLPIVGNLHQLYGSMEHIWTMLRKYGDAYYPIYRLWVFEDSMVMIRHPDDAEVFLNSTRNITKGSMYDSLHPWLGTGLLTSTGAKWKNRRKLLTPAFHFNVLNQFAEVFDGQAKQLVTSVKNSGQKVLDLIPVFTTFTLNTICETAMGTRLEDNDKSQTDFRFAVYYMGHIVLHLLISPWAQIKWLFKLSPAGRQYAADLKVLHTFSTNIIEERKRYHEENKVTELSIFTEEDQSPKYDTDKDITPKKKVALLDLLIQLWKRGKIDDVGIREEVDTFVFEGHDTTASGLVFTILLLAEHGEIQDRARKEVNEVFERSNGKLGMAELQNLVYLERCIKEALRLFPSVATIARKLSDDVKLSGYTIPKGSTVSLSIYDLHRDPNFWPNPHQYDPDRFLPEKIKNRHPYSYVPFSAGPRNCIGQKFAMLELKSSVAHLLHNFRMEAIDKAGEAQLLMDLIIRSTHPLRVKFSPIN